jgi:hypothetical protein
MRFDPYKQEREQQIQDDADESLQQIINAKMRLKESLDNALAFHPHIHGTKALAEAMGACEDGFDDLFHAEWHDHLEKASSDWPAEIPAFEVLSFETPKQKADKQWELRNRVPTNPQTHTDLEKPL